MAGQQHAPTWQGLGMAYTTCCLCGLELAVNGPPASTHRQVAESLPECCQLQSISRTASCCERGRLRDAHSCRKPSSQVLHSRGNLLLCSLFSCNAACLSV